MGLELTRVSTTFSHTDFPELEARLHALMRRSRPDAAESLRQGRLAFDPAARRVSVGGEE